MSTSCHAHYLPTPYYSRINGGGGIFIRRVLKTLVVNLAHALGQLYMKNKVQPIAYKKVKLKMAEFEGILFDSFSPPKISGQLFFVAGLMSWQLSTFFFTFTLFFLYFYFLKFFLYGKKDNNIYLIFCICLLHFPTVCVSNAVFFRFEFGSKLQGFQVLFW